MELNDRKITIAMAIGHLRNDDLLSAQKELECESLSLKSVPIDELIDNGINFRNLHKYKDALACFDAAKDPELLYELGDLCIENNCTDIARLCYIAALSISHNGEEDSSSIPRG
jgi:hypothetical protein